MAPKIPLGDIMKILVACEFSGRVRDAFLNRGHDALSCDLLPSEREGPHFQGDVRELLKEKWHMIIAHPPCTYLTNSGVRWLWEQAGRWELMQEAAQFFKIFLDLKCDKIAVENPIPHKYALEIIGRKYDQKVQPYWFGHGETKATCLWIKNLPELKPTNLVPGRVPRVHHMPPSPDRWKERSRTYEGIAQAMAEQWG